jgi:hypothetical protein
MNVFGENLYRIGATVGDDIMRNFGALTTTVAGVQDGVLTEGQGRLARSIPDVFILSAALAAEKKDALGRDSWYPSLDLMTARTSEGSVDGFYLAMQAAPNQRAHGHNDSGSFIVFRDGDPVFVDIGPEAYTAARYKFSVQSAYHNLPTIGGVMQSAAKPQYRASDVQYFADDARATVALNLGTAYPEEAGITRWIRTLTLDRAADRIRLNEDFQLQKSVAVQLSFMTPRVPAQGPTGKVVFPATEKPGRDVILNYDATLIVPTIEKIDVTDDWLVDRWGKTLYRVLLTSVAPTDNGKWVIEIA